MTLNENAKQLVKSVIIMKRHISILNIFLNEFLSEDSGCAKLFDPLEDFLLRERLRVKCGRHSIVRAETLLSSKKSSVNTEVWSAVLQDAPEHACCETARKP